MLFSHRGCVRARVLIVENALSAGLLPDESGQRSHPCLLAPLPRRPRTGQAASSSSRYCCCSYRSRAPSNRRQLFRHAAASPAAPASPSRQRRVVVLCPAASAAAPASGRRQSAGVNVDRVASYARERSGIRRPAAPAAAAGRGRASCPSAAGAWSAGVFRASRSLPLVLVVVALTRITPHRRNLQDLRPPTPSSLRRSLPSRLTDPQPWRTAPRRPLRPPSRSRIRLCARPSLPRGCPRAQACRRLRGRRASTTRLCHRRCRS